MAKEFTTEEIAIGIFGGETERPKKPAAVADPGDQEAPAAPAKPEAEAGTIPEGYKLTRESKTARTQILLRPTIKEKLRQIAAAEDTSINELINAAIDKYIEERQGQE